MQSGNVGITLENSPGETGAYPCHTRVLKFHACNILTKGIPVGIYLANIPL